MQCVCTFSRSSRCFNSTDKTNSASAINWSASKSTITAIPTSQTCPSMLSEECKSPSSAPSSDFRNIPLVPPRRSSPGPNFSQLRSQSLASSNPSSDSAPVARNNWRQTTATSGSTVAANATASPARPANGTRKSPFTRAATFDSYRSRAHPSIADPFDAEWAAIATRTESNIAKSTNPFTQASTAKAFEVQL